MTKTQEDTNSFPISAGILFGLGLGGFFDGIVLHQLLQWHHMLTSAGVPADTVDGLELNTLWDGLFHTGTLLLVVNARTLLLAAIFAAAMSSIAAELNSLATATVIDI